MGRLLSLVRGVESSIRSRLGQWMQEVSLAGDQIPGIQADVVQLQADVTSPGGAYLTQTTWYVDAVTGNDSNDGATALTALKTLAELERRWHGRTFSPAVAAVTVSLSGSFANEHLALSALFTYVPNDITSGTPVTISGPMTQVDAGTITAYQAWNSAADLRGQITDAAQDFTAHVWRRIRIVGGAADGAVSYIGSLGGGPTVANVGRFRRINAGSLLHGQFVDPAPGDAYVIETPDTQFLDYQLDLTGAFVTLRDVKVAANGAKTTSHCKVLGGSDDWSMFRAFGVLYDCSAGAGSQVYHQGGAMLLSCGLTGIANSGGLQIYKTGFLNAKGLCLFNPLYLYASLAFCDSTMHDGNGVCSAHLTVFESATFDSANFDAYFNCTNALQTSLIRLDYQGFYANTGAYFWGAAGNLKTNALWVGNGSGMIYAAAALPKATGATPGVNDAVVSNVGMAWAAITGGGGYLAPSPDNGFVNVKY